jgi:3-deoxy-D-manno-octulosonic-acid transferase
MLRFYSFLTRAGEPALHFALGRRRRRGKEDAVRLPEKKGLASVSRPEGPLVWFHAVSVGEAQATLALIDALLAAYPRLHILVTTVTVTSAQLTAARLPARCIHQFYPADHPRWVKRFLDHWRPDLALWMESEIWPNMLTALKRRGVPAALINARLSERSAQRWKFAGRSLRRLLSTFSVCLAQTEEDAARFRAFGLAQAVAADNLKYSATPLPAPPEELERLRTALGSRRRWVYASTHDGEERMGCRIHEALRGRFSDLLTVIVPRHPARAAEILETCRNAGLRARVRGEQHDPPAPGDDIYIVDTLGELGLFYRLSPIACIGRSFSNDGGGGHNPIEAARLACAVLHGPHVQNLARIYEELDAAGGALPLHSEDEFTARLEELLADESKLAAIRDRAFAFAREKDAVLERTLAALAPLLARIGAAGPEAPAQDGQA